MKNIEDILIDINNKIYKELSLKIKNIKKKGLPLLIKINSHPCSGKTTFIIKNKSFYNSCKLYDFDKYPEGKKKISDMLLEKKCNSILFGCSGGGLNRPYNREKDYDIHDNVIYLFIFPKLNHLYEYISNRQLKKGIIRWSNQKKILNYRNNMYKLIIKNKEQIRPLFYSFKEGIDFCIQEYNK